MEEVLGGYIEGYDQKNKNQLLSPDINFLIELNKAWEFLGDKLITRSEYELIKDLSQKFNYKIHKNPALILIGYIVYKNSIKKTIGDLSKTEFTKIVNAPEIQPLIKEYFISQCDILRYARYFKIHLSEYIRY